MGQQSLFKKMPDVNDRVMPKDQIKSVVQKAQGPLEQKTLFTVRSKNVKVVAQLEIIKQMAATHLSRHADEYELTTDPDRLWKYAQVMKYNGIGAVDTETTGLDPIVDHMVGLCLYTPGEKPLYAPIRHINVYGEPLPDQMPIGAVQSFFREIVGAGVKQVYHNAKYDIRILRRDLGYYMLPYWDTQLAAHFLNDNLPAYKLKGLYDQYIEPENPEKSLNYDDLCDGINFAYVPPDIAYLYGAGDPYKTFKLYEFQEQYLNPENESARLRKLDDTGRLFLGVEMPLTAKIAEMEDTGVCIDPEMAQKLAVKYGDLLKQAETKAQAEIAKLKDQIRNLPAEVRNKLDDPVNLNSPPQMAIIFYDVLGLESPDKEKPRGTGEEILEELAKEHQEITLFEHLLDVRGYSKLMGTYIEKMPREVKKETGRLHGSFNQYGAKTGRFSSSNPNLQNIPSKTKDIRKMFVASEGYVLIGGDYSQQEPRVLAQISGDEGLRQAYAEGKDLYAWLGAKVYNVPYEDCLEFKADGTLYPEGKRRRSDMKVLLLALMYGKGVRSVAVDLGVDHKKAQEIVDLFFNTFPKIKLCIEMYQQHVRDFGYVQTIWGRKRRLPDYNLPPYEFEMIDGSELPEGMADYLLHQLNQARSIKQKANIKKEARVQGVRVIDNNYKIAEAGRQILNSVIQGSSADITKKAMLVIANDEQLKAWGFRMLLTVHDEIIGEAPIDNAVKCAERMRELMIAAPTDRIKIPMKVDVEIMRRWNGENLMDELKKAS